MVCLPTPKLVKLAGQWLGPYTVIKKLSDVTYKIKKDDHPPQIVHIDKLKNVMFLSKRIQILSSKIYLKIQQKTPKVLLNFPKKILG